MDEGEILELGRKLVDEYAKLEAQKIKWKTERLEIMKQLSLLYTYGRELDMLIDTDSTFPLVIKFMVERIRGLTSSLIWREPNEEEVIEVNLYIND